MILGSDAAVAVGRFRKEGVLGYRAKSDARAPVRGTRKEAEEDERKIRENDTARRAFR